MRTVLETLKKSMLYAKFTKCEFWLSKVAFLGHVVSNEGVSMDPRKIETVMKWLRPKTLTKVRSLLGLTGYYCAFVQNF